MKQAVEILVVIPVGPGCKLSFIADTIDSYTHNTTKNYKLIIADDSHKGTGDQLKLIYPQIDVVATPKPMGKGPGLYITLSLAFSYALDHFDFKVLVRLDTDALVIGSEPETAALKLFSDNPKIGLAGQYPLDYHGNPRDIGWPYARIVNGTTTWKFLRRPRANWILRKLFKKALINGYNTGESVFGGACFCKYKLPVEIKRPGITTRI